MRPTRTIALVVLVLAATIGSALVSPAHATARPRHQLSAKGFEQGSTDRFFVEGRVKTLPSGKVRILRNVDGGRFRIYKVVPTSSTGHFLTRIAEVRHERTCFKVQAPGTAAYRRTTSPNLGCITFS
jgi:hypothetical protein